MKKLQCAFPFIFSKHSCDLSLRNHKILHVVWNTAIFVCSSIAIGLLSLLLGIGDFSVYIFIDYFRCAPLLLLLNILPVLMLQLMFLCIFNRQWLAFFLNALVILGSSIGNYYKLIFRAEPFSFPDITAIGAGLGIAGQYDIVFNGRIWLALFGTIFGTLFFFFFVRGRMKFKARIAVLLICVLSIWPLWTMVYSNKIIYNDKTDNYDNISDNWATQVFVSKGFVYPFIYSIKQNPYTPPEDYSEAQALEILSAYTDSDIPEDRRINVMVLQLETFVDLESIGFSGIAPEAYEILRQIQAESVSGRLVTNVFGGGTLNTEQCIMTGSYKLPIFRDDTYSYLWYMKSQDYTTIGTHPWLASFYNRQNANKNLGFDKYTFFEDCFEARMADDADQYASDYLFFPQVLEDFRSEIAKGNNVFSYSISMQGHTPFDATTFHYDKALWDGEGCSLEAYNEVNNFLWLNYDTQIHLRNMIEDLRSDENPVVLMFYGDHLPTFSTAYSEAGINFNQQTEEGFFNYYSTPYVIWANDAAKAQLGNSFEGEGADTSVGYLMNILFNELGWEGPRKMKFTESLRDTLSVINYLGYYIENGSFTTSLDEETQRALKNYDTVQYYLARNFEH